MWPEFVSVGPLTIHTYGVLLALGAGIGLWLLARHARQDGLNPDQILNLALWVLIAALLGARLAFVLIEPQEFLAQPWRVLALWEGGLVFYGGLFGGLLAGLALARIYGLPYLRLLDAVAPSLAIGQAIGRVGCFAAGCCYGAPWENGWCAVTFTSPLSLAPLNIPLHPAQLYTSAALGCIFIFLMWLWPRRRFVGQVFLAYGVLHGLARVVIEHFRSDWRGPELLFGFTPTGWFAFSMAVLCGAGYLWLGHRARQGREGTVITRD